MNVLEEALANLAKASEENVTEALWDLSRGLNSMNPKQTIDAWDWLELLSAGSNVQAVIILRNQLSCHALSILPQAQSTEVFFENSAEVARLEMIAIAAVEQTVKFV